MTKRNETPWDAWLLILIYTIIGIGGAWLVKMAAGEVMR